jgi:nucleoid-associated protein YgaU
MKNIHLLPLSVAVVFAASCANQKTDEFDTLGYEFDDYGTPDGAPYQDVNPVYDSAPAYEEARLAPVRPTTPARPSTPARAQTNHTVVRGDTLWGLSRKYGVSVDAIKQANNMRNDTVVLGTRLVIPAR